MTSPLSKLLKRKLFLALTSSPSLFMIELSILRMAALIVLGGGKTVRPMLMALDLFGSRTTISFLPVASARCKYRSQIYNQSTKKLLNINFTFSLASILNSFTYGRWHDIFNQVILKYTFTNISRFVIKCS